MPMRVQYIETAEAHEKRRRAAYRKALEHLKRGQAELENAYRDLFDVGTINWPAILCGAVGMAQGVRDEIAREVRVWEAQELIKEKPKGSC